MAESKKFKNEDGVEFWAESDGKFWTVVAAAPGYPATEAWDDWFANQADAEDVAEKLSKGEM